jgi:L-lactate dehydrogenase complex protein LldG
MSARDEILQRVRAARAAAADTVTVPRAYRTDAAVPDLIELLVDRLLDYKAGVCRCPGADLPAAVAEALADATGVVVPAGLPAGWLSTYRGRVVRDGDPHPLAVADLDAAGVAVLTGCAVAIAETGTLILDAGPGQGRRALTLVPDHHVCVVHIGQVVATVPQALARLTDPTRPLTLVSGPSATSDIELNRVEGVHGPRRLEVVLVES